MPKPRRGKPAKAPVSSHPLFAALAALWFAALFGLACLVLPARLLETVVGLIGLPALVPAAAPPLGMTARMLIALAAAGLGLAVGLLIARMIAGTPRRARADTGTPRITTRVRRSRTPREPLSAQDETRNETNDVPAPPRASLLAAIARFTRKPAQPSETEAIAEPPPRRRRSFIAADTLTSDELALSDASHTDEQPIAPATAPQPEAPATAAAEAEPPLPAAPAAMPFPADHADAAEDAARAVAPVPETVRPMPSGHCTPLGERLFEDLSIVELVERLAQALLASRAHTHHAAPPAPTPAQAADTPAMPTPIPMPETPVANIATERHNRAGQNNPQQALRDALATLQRISGTG